MTLPTQRLRGRFWRMLAPRWAHLPLDGRGAAKRGGRFNPLGSEALYMSLEFATAVAEYEQDLGIRPGTLCAYDVDSEDILDLRNPEVMAGLGIEADVPGCPWKQYAFVRKTNPPTWELATRLVSAGVAGILVPSFQAKAGSNLVLWSWNTVPGRKVVALDPLHDLPRDARSWPEITGEKPA